MSFHSISFNPASLVFCATLTFDFKLNYALDDSGPSIFTAVQEQLGLKLEAAKGPVRTLVIDHAEKPAEN